MSIFIVLVEYSAAEASAAAACSREAAHKVEKAVEQSTKWGHVLDTHMKVNIEKDKAILSKLEDIRKEVSSQRDEQQIILKKLLQLIEDNHATP